MTEWTLPTRERGVLLRVCEWSGDGPPIVVLHGFLEQGAAWHEVATRLSRRVVAPDQRGHGRSGHVGTGGFYHFWDYVGDLDALVEHLGAPVDLVGHSMGGTVACLYAGTRPEAVRRLVLVEGLGPPDMSRDPVDRARRYLADLRRGPTHNPVASVNEAIERMHTYNPRLPLPTAERLARRGLRPRDDGRLTWTWDPLHRARAPVPFQITQFRHFLANLTMPVTVVRGGASSFVLEDEDDRVAAIGGKSVDVRVIEDAGHLVHHDSPDALADILREALP
ncbi:MAG: alpha/beta hydrolase [Myxococcota bacterium]